MNNRLTWFAWGLSTSVSGLAVLVWGSGLNWHLTHISNYRLFPIFGLLAFSLMWSMYAVSFVKRRWFPKADELKSYYQTVPALILACILIHPSLLVWQLWRDGFGLPPLSYINNYVAAGAKWAVILSSTVWLVFLAYEFRHRFRDRSWWRYMEIAADLGLIGIFFHALKLGINLQHGWFHFVWLFYGLSLIAILADLYYHKYFRAKLL